MVETISGKDRVKVKNHPVIWFYILAFAISWFGWVPLALGSRGIAPFDNPYFQILLIFPAVGPTLAAIIVLVIMHGKTGVQGLFKAFIQWRVGFIWYIIAVLGPVILFFAAQLTTRVFGLPAIYPGQQGISFFLTVFVSSLVANPWEEIGWRGFALPRLQKQYSALLASLIVGILWGLWHLPLFFWVGGSMADYPFIPWFIGIIADAFLFTWLYNSTKGSLLLVALFHISLNTTGALISGVSTIASTIVTSIVAILVMVLFGRTNLSRLERQKSG
jgi:membrane protease YdiL (CAAX protease family)